MGQSKSLPRFKESFYIGDDIYIGLTENDKTGIKLFNRTKFYELHKMIIYPTKIELCFGNKVLLIIEKTYQRHKQEFAILGYKLQTKRGLSIGTINFKANYGLCKTINDIFILQKI
jgi:hypothetical protein